MLNELQWRVITQLRVVFSTELDDRCERLLPGIRCTYVADNIRNASDGIAFQAPKPRLTLWWLRRDELLIKLRPRSMTRRNWVKVVVIVVITIQAIAIQVILVDSSTRGDDVGGADVDNVGVAHNTIIEMIERELELTLDKEFLQLFHSGRII